MDATPFLAYAAALAVAAIIPGPGVAALVGQALGGGLRPALFFLGGIVLGDLTYLTIAIAGLAALAQLFSAAVLVLKILGGLYLLFMAHRIWTSKAELGPIQTARSSGAQSLMAGYAVTLGNPKAIIFYLALMPGVLDLSAVGVPQWAALALISALVLVLVLSPYILLAHRARQRLSRSATLRLINRGAGAIIGAAGLLMIGQATRALARPA